MGQHREAHSDMIAVRNICGLHSAAHAHVSPDSPRGSVLPGRHRSAGCRWTRCTVLAWRASEAHAHHMVRESKVAREQRQLAEQVDAVMDASKALVGVAAQSLAEAQETLTMTQWRALVIINSRSPIHLTALAEAMKVHPSNATRTVDRLVGSGLVDRRDNPADRRHLALTLTRKGQRLVDRVMQRRWEAIADIVRRMPAAGRQQLSEVLAEFSAAAGEPSHHDLWSAGWTTAERSSRPA